MWYTILPPLSSTCPPMFAYWHNLYNITSNLWCILNARKQCMQHKSATSALAGEWDTHMAILVQLSSLVVTFRCKLLTLPGSMCTYLLCFSLVLSAILLVESWNALCTLTWGELPSSHSDVMIQIASQCVYTEVQMWHHYFFIPLQSLYQKCISFLCIT